MEALIGSCGNDTNGSVVVVYGGTAGNTWNHLVKLSMLILGDNPDCDMAPFYVDGIADSVTTERFNT